MHLLRILHVPLRRHLRRWFILQVLHHGFLDLKCGRILFSFEFLLLLLDILDSETTRDTQWAAAGFGLYVNTIQRPSCVRALALCSCTSIRPLISIISCTAVWNLPCTLRRRHAACKTVAFSLVICPSCATSSTAESTTSYGCHTHHGSGEEALRRPSSGGLRHGTDVSPHGDGAARTPWPVRSDSPDTLSRSFWRCSFGSVQRSFAWDGVCAK